MNKFLHTVAATLLSVSSFAYASTCITPKVSLPTIHKGAVLVFGEIHGSKESPDYFLRATCAAIEEYPRKPLLIGLEIPISEQGGLDRFVSSDGGPNAVKTLLSLPFWNRSMQDGRSSHAMFQLIDGLRLLRKRTPNMIVAAIDDQSLASTRDASMAAQIDNLMIEYRDARALVLLGNYHAKRRPRQSLEEHVDSMVEFLSTPNRSLAFRPRDGRYWACAPRCEVHTLNVNTDANEAVNWFASEPSSSENFDGLIDLGTISESVPAVSAEQH